MTLYDYLSTLNTAAAAAPLVPAIATLGISGFLHRYRSNQEGDVLSDDQVAQLTTLGPLRDGPSSYQRHSIGFTLSGTGGTGIGESVFKQLALAGLHQYVSFILVAEPDDDSRNEFLANLPAVFHDRVILAHPTNKGGGNDHDPPELVIPEVDLWGRRGFEAAHQTIDDHLRRTGNRHLKMIIDIKGLGGSALLTSIPLEVLKERFGCQVISIIALSEFKNLRQRYPTVKKWSELFAGVDAWIPIDNMHPFSASSDFAVSAFITGMLESPRHADAALHFNNAVAEAASDEDANGAVILLRMVTIRLASFPYYPVPGGPPGHFIQRDVLADQVIIAARQLDDGEGLWTAALPVDDSPVFDLFCLPIDHHELLYIQDAVQLGRWIRGRVVDAWENDRSPDGHLSLFRRPDYALIFSRLPTVITTPERAHFPIVGIRMVVALNTPDLDENLAEFPQRRRLPQTTEELGEPIQSPVTTNGYQSKLEIFS